MTSKSDQARAIILAALMVISVVAMTTAFSGAAAAQSLSGPDGDATPSVVPANTTTEHVVEVNATFTSNETHTISIRVADSGVTIEDASGLQVDTGNQTTSDLTPVTDTDGIERVNITADTDGSTDNDLNFSFTTSITSPGADGEFDIVADLDEGNNGTFDKEGLTVATVVVDDTAPVVSSAVEFDDTNTGIASSEESTIELGFETSIENKTVTADGNSFTGNFEVFVNGEDVTGDYDVADDGTDGQLTLSSSTGLDPTDDVEVNITAPVTDDTGNQADLGNQSVEVTGTTVAESGASETTFVGTQIAFVADDDTPNLDQPVAIRADNNTIFSGSTGVGSEVFTFDTTDEGVGTTLTFDQNSTSTDVGLRDLDLSATVDNTEISDADDLTGDISARDGNRDVAVTLTDSDGDTVDTQDVRLDGGADGTFNFGTVTADTYSIEVEDVNSGVTDSTNDVNVTETAAGAAALGDDSGVVSVEQGDFADITVQLTGTAVGGDATLIIGSDSVGYQANVSVTDGSEDGEVTVVFNTYAAGSDSNGTVVAADNSDDTVSLADQDEISRILATGDYDLAVSTGNVTETIDDPNSVGTVVIEERSAGDQLIWTADSSLLDDIDDADNRTAKLDVIETAIDDGDLTQADSVAAGDAVVHLIGGSGLSGLLQSSTAQELFNESVTSGEGIADDTPLNLRVRQTAASTPPNEEPNRIDSDILDNGVLLDDQNDDRVFVAYNIDDTSASAADGESYDSRFRIQDQRLLDPDQAELESLTPTEERSTFYQTNTARFGVEERTVEFDQDPFDVAPETGQTISGTTSVAPGTEFNIRIRSSGDTRPAFTKTAEDVPVQDSGTFSAEFDFSEQETGDEYTVTIRQLDAGQPTVDGTVEAGDAAEFVVSDLNPTDVTATQGDVIEVSATVTNDGGSEATQTVEFRVGDTVLADQELTLAAGAEETVTFEGLDTSPLEPDDYTHGVFTDDDSQTATLTIEAADDATETETETEAPADEETETATEMETATPTEDGVPGFGAIVALIALVAAAMLATRRKAE